MSDALKGLLGDDLYNQVIEKSGLKPNEFDLLKNYVPRSRLNEATKIKKELEDKVTNFENQAKETKKLLSENEDLKNKYNILEENSNKDREIYNNNISKIKMTGKAENAFIAKGGKHVDMLVKELNFDKMSFDGDNLLGLDAEVDRVMKERADFFTTSNSNTNHQPQPGSQQQQQQNNNPSDIPQFDQSFFDKFV